MDMDMSIGQPNLSTAQNPIPRFKVHGLQTAKILIGYIFFTCTFRKQLKQDWMECSGNDGGGEVKTQERSQRQK